MKMQCTEGTTLGEKISLRLFLPGQASIEAEEEPEFILFLTDFAMGDDPESEYIFIVPAFALLAEAVCDHEEANAVAGWLERWATNLRGRSKAPWSATMSSPLPGTGDSKGRIP